MTGFILSRKWFRLGDYRLLKVRDGPAGDAAALTVGIAPHAPALGRAATRPYQRCSAGLPWAGSMSTQPAKSTATSRLMSAKEKSPPARCWFFSQLLLDAVEELLRALPAARDERRDLRVGDGPGEHVVAEARRQVAQHLGDGEARPSFSTMFAHIRVSASWRGLPPKSGGLRLQVLQVAADGHALGEERAIVGFQHRHRAARD